jgi:hypothetical protein
MNDENRNLKQRLDRMEALEIHPKFCTRAKEVPEAQGVSPS